jgi:putrescine aminotransferase
MNYLENFPPTAEIQRIDADHHLHPFTDHGALNARGSRVITRADGVYVWDSEGNRIIDGMAGLWCVNVGYGRREIADAVHRQLLQLPYYNTFFQTTHPAAAELSRILAEVTPDGLDRVFFTNSGSEANDTVLRMVRRFWELEGKPERSVVVGRRNGYHGSTMAGASLGGMAAMHAQGGLPIPGIVHIGQPHWYREGGDMEREAFGLKMAAELEEAVLSVGADKVGAFIGEPIQGAGGVVIPPDSYWPEIQRICRKYDLLLIVDEVICGFGRTGRWFGSDTFDIKPDLMPIAKGMSSGYVPIGGVMVGGRVAGRLIADGGEFFHGFTYSGHPAACAAAIENLRILREEKIIERAAADTAPYFKQRWSELADHKLVGEARMTGLIGALELVRDKATRQPFDDVGTVGTKCRDACFRNNVVMRAVGDTMVVSPPLIISRDEIDELVSLARRSLDDTLAEIS